MRFRTKTIVGVALIEIALLAVLVGSALSILRESNEAELVRRVQLGARLLGGAAKDAVISQDLATLDSLATETMRSGQVEYVRILDAQGSVLAQGGDAWILARPFHEEESIDQVRDGIFERSQAVMAGGVRHGEVQIGVSVSSLQVLLASAQRWAAGVAALEILLVALFSWLLGTYLVRQLGALREASERIAAGDFAHRVGVTGNDELAQTAQAFNAMAQHLSESRVKLQLESSRWRQAMETAEKAENLLREAVSSIAQGFTIYDEHDRLVQCNETYLRFYETSRDLIVPGRTFEEIVRQGAERGQYSAALGDVDAWVKQRVAQHQAANGEVLEQQLTDGRWLLILEYRTPSGYIVGNRIDITERKELAAREREYAEQLGAIFELSPDGFVSFDGAGRVKYISPAFSRLTGLPQSEILGLDESAFSLRMAKICTPEAAFPGVASLRGSSKSGPGQDSLDTGGQQLKIELADASKRVLDVGLREKNTESVKTILYLRDITHETEVDRLKSEFLSTAAHELRTPMTSIYGFVELLLTQELDENDWREYLRIIFRHTELMVSIINELLDLARIEARHGKDFQIVIVDVAELLQEIVAGFKPPDGRVVPQVPGFVRSTRVMADRKKLIQAVLNVLSNAYKYSPDGGTVEIEIDHVAAGADSPLESGAAALGISVIDHGMGMTPEQLARVFERFYRADTSGKIPGTGLGMSIVQEIVTLHGGRVRVVSTAGLGTAVTIWLPEAEAGQE